MNEVEIWLQTLRLKSLDFESLDYIAHEMLDKTGSSEWVADNKNDLPKAYIELLCGFQNVYNELENHKKIEEYIIKILRNIQITVTTNDVNSSFKAAVWLLSRLYDKDLDETRSVLQNHIGALLELLDRMKFVFDIKDENGIVIFPVSAVIEGILDHDQFENGINETTVQLLQLAVRLFHQDRKETILKRLKTENNLKFIDYLETGCMFLDNDSFDNYKKNGVMVFWNGNSSVLVRSANKEYFSGEDVEAELDTNKNVIGYYWENTVNSESETKFLTWNEAVEKEENLVKLLRLLFDENCRNIFYNKPVIIDDGTCLKAANPFCINDKYIIGERRVEKDNILKLIGKTRLSSVSGNTINRISFGTCVQLLLANNTGVDALGLSDLENSNIKQNQVILNWLKESKDNTSAVEYILTEWNNQLNYSKSFKTLENYTSKIQDFMPYEVDNLQDCYESLCGERDVDVYFGRIISASSGKYVFQASQDTFSIDVEIADEGTDQFSNPVKIDTEPEKNAEYYLLYKQNEHAGKLIEKSEFNLLHLLKEIASKECLMGNKLIQSFIPSYYNQLRTIMELYKIEFRDAMKEITNSLDDAWYYHILHNLIWSHVNECNVKDYIDLFGHHQILTFKDISEDCYFNALDTHTLYVPKDRIMEHAVLSSIYYLYLAAKHHRDKNPLFDNHLSMKKGKYCINGNEIRSIVFLTDNMMSGSATKKMLKTYLINSDSGSQDESDYSSNRIQRYYDMTGEHEIKLSEIIKANTPRIYIHAYYGTEDAKKTVLLDINNSGYEFSVGESDISYNSKISSIYTEEIVEKANMFWKIKKADTDHLVKKKVYACIREFNMPKMHVFPKVMLNPKMAVSLMVLKEENH